MILVDAARVLGAHLDAASIEAGAAALRKDAAAVRDAGLAVMNAWQGLASSFETPDTDQVLRSLDPVRAATQELASDLEQVARALDRFAQDVRSLQSKRAGLVARIGDFRDRAASDAGGLGGVGSPATLDPQRAFENTSLLNESRLLGEEFETAELECANTIKALGSPATMVQRAAAWGRAAAGRVGSALDDVGVWGGAHGAAALPGVRGGPPVPRGARRAEKTPAAEQAAREWLENNDLDAEDEFVQEYLKKFFGGRGAALDVPDPEPGPPPWDPGPSRFDITESREYGITPPTVEDRATYLQMRLVQAALSEHFEWNHAAAYLDHYLNGSGEDAWVDPQDMLEDLPSLRDRVNLDLSTADASGSLDTGWQGHDVNIRTGKDSLDWYYAFYHYEYRVSGTVEDYDLEVRKRYDWGVPSEDKTDLTFPKEGVALVRIPQPAVARLHSTDLAQDYSIYGKTTLSGEQ